MLLQQHLEDFDGVDVLFVSPTLHNTHVEATVRMIEAIGPHRVFAQHFGTYVPTPENSFWTVGYPEEVAERLPAALRKRYTVPEPGVVYRV